MQAQRRAQAMLLPTPFTIRDLADRCTALLRENYVSLGLTPPTTLEHAAYQWARYLLHTQWRAQLTRRGRSYSRKILGSP
jgi:hypothetical protein